MSMPVLLPAAKWVVIAYRPRDPNGTIPLLWHRVPGAPLSVSDARRMAAAGRIVMANQHFEHRVELVVRLLSIRRAALPNEAFTLHYVLANLRQGW